jgi:hypothetical protein
MMHWKARPGRVEIQNEILCWECKCIALEKVKRAENGVPCKACNQRLEMYGWLWFPWFPVKFSLQHEVLLKAIYIHRIFLMSTWFIFVNSSMTALLISQ